MEGAAQAAVLEAAESEVGAPVRTGALDQAIAALIVAEDDEVFAEQAHRLERPVVGQFIDQRGRLPVAPHELARRRARTGAGEKIVLLGAQHARSIRSSNLEQTLPDRAHCGPALPHARAAGREPRLIARR